MSSIEMSIVGAVAAPAEVAAPAREAGVGVNNESEKRQPAATDGNSVPRPTSSIEELHDALQGIANYVKSVSREVSFSVDESTGSTIVSVYDTETAELIRQIPSNEVLSMARHLSENAPDPLRGMLVDGKG